MIQRKYFINFKHLVEDLKKLEEVKNSLNILKTKGQTLGENVIFIRRILDMFHLKLEEINMEAFLLIVLMFTVTVENVAHAIRENKNGCKD